MKASQPRSREEARAAFLAIGESAELPEPQHEDWQAVLDALPERLRTQAEASRVERLFGDLLLAAGNYALGHQVQADTLDNPGRRTQLKKLAKDAERLMARLNSLDPLLWLALDDAPIDPEDGEEPTRTGVNLEALGQELALLHEVAAGNLRDGVAEPRSGPSALVHRKILTERLVSLWEEYTGEAAGYTWDPLAKCYRSSFLTFAETVTRALLKERFSERPYVEWIKWKRAGR